MNRKILYFIILISVSSLINAQEFRKPILLKADGELINIKDGYCAPRFYDYDKDGNFDLIVGTLFGNFVYFKNLGTNKKPVFTEKGCLKDGKVLLRANNW